ncbi:MAG TPA: pantoate--beta-alanine ligase [Mycobacteriales bacterium]
MTTVVHTRDELARAQASRPGPTGLVMTMGALHSGHAALLRQARLRAATVVATVFVNPLQFGPGEDFDRYPRTLDADVAVCEAEQVDIVFAPPVEEVFPRQPLVTVRAGPLGEILEGAHRPGHFDGMLTVVNRMFHLVGGVDAAFFGEKDYQQLTLIRQMVADFALGLEIVGVPTVREPDGLALSSRNRYLSEDERRSALALSRALRAGPVEAKRILDAEPGLELDYLELRAPDLGPAPGTGEARLLVAARVGTTRLIDNLAVHLAEGR